MIIILMEVECGLLYRHWLSAFLSSGVRRSSRGIFREVQSNYRKMSEIHTHTNFYWDHHWVTDWRGVFSSIIEPGTPLFHLQSFKMHIPLRRKLKTSSQSDTHPAAEVEPGLDPASGGLIGSRELQGGRMLIIKRPQVAKFMFIWVARRKFFPAKRK